MHPATLKYLLSRSALYGLLARCFSQPENGGWAIIMNLSKEVPKEWQGPIKGLLSNGPPPAEVFMKFFGTAGTCHDCETAYLAGLPTGGTLADVAGFYQAFSFPGPSKKGNPPDHVATQLEFLSFMFAKEARALFNKDKEARRVCLSAREKFVREHLSQWIPLFTDGVIGRVPHNFYTRAATILMEAIKEETG